MRCSKSSSKREVYNNKCLKKERSQINNLILHLKELEKEKQTELNISRWKEIIELREEISDKK